MVRLSLLVTGTLFFAGASIRAGEKGSADTIIYLQKLQADNGGYRLNAGAKQPTLRATSAALRAIHYLGGELRNPTTTARFVEGCFDPATGGFADHHAAKPDVFSTAVGVMAAVELKLPRDRYVAPALKYLDANARSFEDIRIAAAAFESAGKAAPRNQEWLKEIRKSAHTDGIFGTGAGQARATGGAVAAILRLGGKVEHRDQVLALLKHGQRKSGGFGKEDGREASDLETTYRVMRTFMMLKARPADVPALEGFIAKCHNRDGGYGVTPGQPSSVSGCYYAAIMRHWLK